MTAPKTHISCSSSGGAGGLPHPQPLRDLGRHICPALAALTRESADCAGFFSCTPAGSPAGTAKRTANIRFIRFERQKYESGRIFALQFAPALLPGRGRRRAPGSRSRPNWPLAAMLFAAFPPQSRLAFGFKRYEAQNKARTGRQRPGAHRICLRGP